MQQQRKPAVITGPELAGILRKMSNALDKWTDDEAILVKHDSNQKSGPFSLSLVIDFDPKTLKAKTTTISTTKGIVKKWNQDYGN
jgi:hypothetical protein